MTLAWQNLASILTNTPEPLSNVSIQHNSNTQMEAFTDFLLYYQFMGHNNSFLFSYMIYAYVIYNDIINTKYPKSSIE